MKHPITYHFLLLGTTTRLSDGVSKTEFIVNNFFKRDENIPARENHSLVARTGTRNIVTFRQEFRQ